MQETEQALGQVAGRLAVLVAERDPRLLEQIALTLRSRGYLTVGHTTAKGALGGLQHTTPNLIILGDLDDLSAEEVARRVRRVPRLQGVRLLLLAGSPPLPEAKALTDAQLHKPFTGSELSRAADALLAGSGAPAKTEQQQHTVMVIEDSAALRGLIGDILHRQGYLVESAENVPQARALIEKRAEHVSLILLDVNLPGGTGFELLKLIRERSEVPVFILSALRQEEQISQGQALGAQAFIEKPFNPRELVAKIRATLT